MDNSFLNSFLNNPEQIVDHFGLIYSTPDNLNIKRTSTKGDFEFLFQEKKIECQKKLDIIKSYNIPPAWKSVSLTLNQKAHILAVGYDLKNRKQYLYNPKWQRIANQTKFLKLYQFSKQLPQLRAQVEKDLKIKPWNLRKVSAIVVRLLQESHIRVGNKYYSKKNKTYGLCTLRSRHLEFKDNKLNIEFKGKRGKTNKVSIYDKKLLKLINRCEEIPGWEIFTYYDEKGKKKSITSTDINHYIHQACGELFSAKDFRTWSASLICFSTLKKRYDDGKTNKKKNLSKAISKSAKALNNTKPVCKKYYIHPYILKSYKNDTILKYFKMADSYESKTDNCLQPEEKALNGLLKTYKPKLIL